MPYITPEDREIYTNEVNALVNKLVYVFASEPTKIARNRAGHLNYLFTTILHTFYERLNKRLGTSTCYADYNEIIGMLECCKQEYYRQFVVPYEETKIKANGPVE